MSSKTISPLLIRALRYAINTPLWSYPKPIRWCLNSRLTLPITLQRRWDSSSSKRWQKRQVNDYLTKLKKVEGYRSRASFKLLQINHDYKLFKPGMTVVDLGYAPGSWTEVAVAATKPGGRVLGVDVIPAIPPKGASTIQGNFQDTGVQHLIKRFLTDPHRGRVAEFPSPLQTTRNYLEMERHEESDNEGIFPGIKDEQVLSAKEWVEIASKETVDVLLSDMFGPWDQVSGHWMNSLTRPYRMMNTSGIRIRDHVGSMELCLSALLFGIDVLKPGGHFVCKFYAGETDKRLEARLCAAFNEVKREKPNASRKESRETFFVAKGFKEGVSKLNILEMFSDLEEAEDKEAMENYRMFGTTYIRTRKSTGAEDEWGQY